MTTFHDFGLAEPITRALAEEKYATPTPIQTQTIPVVLSRRDVIGIAQTRERIRQIEAKALRKLKHPSRSRILRSFLES